MFTSKTIAHPMADELSSSLAGLSANAILRLWEIGAAQHPLDRALTFLMVAEPGLTRAELARLPVGHRDARLLALYARLYGPQIAGQGRCPTCDERAEFELDARAVLAIADNDDRLAPMSVTSGDYVVTYRLPDSFDLAEIARLADVDQARQRLLERCIVQATCDGAEIAAEQLPAEIVALVAEQMAARDPLAVIEVELTCPVCGSQWEPVLDIVTLLWTRLEAQARRLLHEVHTLARAYGWRESDILALSPARRQAYLALT